LRSYCFEAKRRTGRKDENKRRRRRNSLMDFSTDEE
jgi:hypothetical protein